jgi:hypothetical protein
MPVTRSNIFKGLFVSTMLLVASFASAQGLHNSNAWKKQRHEIRIEIGASNFLGDLGGRDKVGSNFLYDLELSKTKFASSFNYLYYLGRKLGVRMSLNYGKVSGDDALTTERFRNNRNLKFESIIIEAGMSIEWHFIKEKPGNLYNVKSVTGKKLGRKSISPGFYLTAGVSAFYFNPKAVSPSGVMTALHPLKTEGQGLELGADPYKRINVAIPIGGGFRKSINRKMGFKIELAHRFTFSDYIDDVSTVYYDPVALEGEVGPEAVYFANPTNGSIPTFTVGSDLYDPTQPGSQRGDPTNKDGYMFLTVGVYFKLRSSSNSSHGRNRVLRVKASF